VNVCVIIPAYNESQNIESLIQALCAKGLEAVVIDDGSTDGTGAVAEKNGAVVMRNNRKEGKGCSLRKGFEYALRRDYVGVITMDGDGQHDVADVDRFIAAAQEHKVSIIAGNRMTDSKGMPFVRYCTNRFMSWLISIACRRAIADTQCGYRYISCDILREIDLTCRDFEIETEILMKACKRGFKVYDVPVRTIYCNEESKISPFKDTIRFFIYFAKEIFSVKR